MELPKEYPLAIGVALAMSLQAWSFGMKIGTIRKEVFNEDFMQKQFGQIHQKELGEPIQRGGYPDTGSGTYSRKLSYRDWYRLNVAQRIHLNYVENINLAQSSVLAAAVYKPKQAAIVGLSFIVARFIFGHFYSKKGGALNKGRLVGAGLSLLAIIVNVGIFGVNFCKSMKK